ncbi:hypothetical protein [Kibdelosporangium aridum]|uniref:hypothetical protein n=1 Tax=Kibdelosporangium aridum TaxID=2030 RepID=UPI0035EF932D
MSAEAQVRRRAIPHWTSWERGRLPAVAIHQPQSIYRKSGSGGRDELIALFLQG